MADTFLAETLAETEDELEQLEGQESEGRGLITEEMLRRILDDNREQNAELVRRVTGQQQVSQRGVPLQQDDLGKEFEFSLEGAPDPAIDPGAFHKWYAAKQQSAAARVAEQLEQRMQANTQRALSDKEAIARANELIKAANPNLTDEVIGMASSVVARRIAASGRDPMTVLRQDAEGVAQDVLDYTDDLVAQLGGRRPERAAETSSNRARGLLSPRTRPAAPRQPQRDAKPDPLALVKEIQSIQNKGRIY